MLDSRKTGAYISQLRRDQDWTQLDLANRVHVTPQAVSRWETGESFPDINTLASLAKVFQVSVDDLLQGEKRAAMEGEKASTGDIMEELAEGKVENVARLVREDKAEVESLIEAAPLTRPSLMEQIIGGLSGFKFNINHIVNLAPYIGRGSLGKVVKESDLSQMSPQILVSLAPFLSSEVLEELVARMDEGEVSPDILVTLAPFLSRSSLDRLVDRIQEGAMEEHHLLSIAPHLHRETVDKLILKGLREDTVNVELLESLAPFMGRSTIDLLLDRIPDGSLNLRNLAYLAPFLTREAMKRIAPKVSKESITPDLIVQLAPHVDQDTLAALIKSGLSE
jgi:transcriptional regulator with XRE-family HTH domain